MNIDIEIDQAKQRFSEWLNERYEHALKELEVQETIRFIKYHNIILLKPPKKKSPVSIQE